MMNSTMNNNSLAEQIAQNVTLNALQGHLGIMQAQCKMILTNTGIENSNPNVYGSGGGGMEVSNIYATNASMRTTTNIESIFSPQSGRKGRGGAKEGAKDVSVIENLDVHTTYDVEEEVNRKEEEELLDGGFHDSLWKRKYSGR